LERGGDAATADLVYRAAAELGARERGSAFVTAPSLRADLAVRHADMSLARKLSAKAYRAVVYDRRRIGQEFYLPSFVVTAQSVRAQYLRLHVSPLTRERSPLRGVVPVSSTN
jgi:hypothetical protein